MTARILAAALAAAALAPRQEPAPRTLAAPTLTLEGFTAVAHVHELGDGRLVVSDPLEPAVVLVDPARGTRTRLGREGSGPGEYRRPGGIYPGRGDSLLLMDRGQGRYLVLDARGTLVTSRSRAIPGSSAFSDADMDIARLDAQGRVYFVAQAFGPRRTATGPYTDSALLVRYDFARGRTDTLAPLRRPEQRVTGRQGNMTFSQATVFSPEDGWALAPGGRVVVVRAEPYRVEWIEPDGRRVTGPVVATDRVAVTEQDRRDFAARTAGGTPLVSGGGQQGSAPAQRQTPFAGHKPPFVVDRIFAAPDGRVWVMRQSPSGAAAVVYDVFDARGARVDRVALPARHHVVGVGRGAVYAAHLDDADLPRLVRVPL